MEHLVCTGFLIHQTEFQQNFRLIHHKLCYKYRHSALFLCPLELRLCLKNFVQKHRRGVGKH